MIKKNQIILYILYFLLITLIIISYNFTDYYLRMFTAVNFHVHISLFLTKEIIIMLFGVSLGLGYILKEIKKEGQWGLNTTKLLILALPCLIIFVIRVLSVSKISFSLLDDLLPHFLPYMKLLNPGFPIFLQIFFGYILVTSLEKKEK